MGGRGSDGGIPSDLWQSFAHAVDAPAPASRAQAGSGATRPCAALASEQFDVLVIGGGITGAGVALDAASRGLADGPGRAGRLRLRHLVEVVQAGPRRAPLPATARIPPGLREPGRAPAAAGQRPPPGVPPAVPHPPVRPRGRVNKSVARVYLVALWLYDLTGGCGSDGVTRGSPGPRPWPTCRRCDADRLVAGFLYWDARADDARLTLTVLRTAVLDYGAVAANHTAATALIDRARRQGVGCPGGPRRRRGLRRPGLGGGQCGRRVVRPGPRPRRASRPPLDPPGQGDPHHRALRGVPVRHRRRHPGPGGPPFDLRRVVGGPGLPRDDGHRVGRTARRSQLSARGHRLHPRTPPTPSPPSPSGPATSPACGPASGPCWPRCRGEARPERAHGRPVPPPHRPDLPDRDGHGDRREAHHLPEDGRGHGGRGGHRAGAATASPASPSSSDCTVREPVGTRRPGPAGPGRRTVPPAPPTPVRWPPIWPVASGPRPPRCWRWPTAGRELLEPLVPGLRYLEAEAVYAVREEMAGSVADVLDRRTRASLRDMRGAADAAARVAELIGPELGWTPPG